MTPEIMRALAAKGFTSDQIADIEEIMGAEKAAKAAARRARNAERMRNVRARAVHDAARSSTDAHIAHLSSSLPSSPSDSPNNYPSTTHDASLRSASLADEKAVLFSEGQRILAGFGIPKERSGALIGGWLKRAGPLVVLHAIEQARDFAVSNPTAYIATILNRGQSHGKQSLSELAHDLAEEVRERERENDLGRTDSDERSRRNRF